MDTDWRAALRAAIPAQTDWGAAMLAGLDWAAAGPVPPHAPALGPCLPWVGDLVSDHGYGLVRRGGREGRTGGRLQAVHRIAWELLVGEVPAGMQLDHVCHHRDHCAGRVCPHRGCASVGHLEVVTARENVLRGAGPTAQNARKLWCTGTPAHPLWPGHPNVYIHPTRGTRHCRECQAMRARAFSLRRRTRMIAGQSSLWD